MKKNYFKHAALAMGIVAVAGSANAEWVNVNNQYLKQAAFIPGWSGALTAAADGVAEAWDAPFELYQELDLPAGEYTLKANAFYRYGSNDYAKANMKDGANHKAYIFLGTQKENVAGLFDKTQEGNPNNTGEAAAAFAAGEFENTVKFTHKGGNLRLGIGCADYRQDQWACFDNFVLTGPSGAVTLENGDFATGIINNCQTKDKKAAWNMENVAGAVKTVDINKDGGANGCYRKTNASAYNFGQLVDLPAGKYRFGVQSFFRHGNGNQSGWYIKLKGFEKVEGESAYDLHVADKEDAANLPLLYVAEDLDGLKPLEQADVDDVIAANKVYAETPVKCIFDEKLDVYPDNEPKSDVVAEGEHGYADSGYENEVAALFVSHPELYRNYVEFELKTPAKVWVGLKKDVNAPAGYWNPFRDFTLEKYVAEGGSAVSEVEVADENAPVEYYNLQGVRVANPTNGLYIVKQGKKVTKQIFK